MQFVYRGAAANRIVKADIKLYVKEKSKENKQKKDNSNPPILGLHVFSFREVLSLGAIAICT